MLGLDKISLVWIVLPFMVAGIFYSKIVRHKTGDPLRDSIKNVQIMFTMMGVLLFVLWFSLPHTASLGTFGYPETVEEIGSQEKLLELLQEYNRAIVRTTEVVYWMLFVFMFWMLMSVYQLLQAYRNRLDKQLAKERNEAGN